MKHLWDAVSVVLSTFAGQRGTRWEEADPLACLQIAQTFLELLQTLPGEVKYISYLHVAQTLLRMAAKAAKRGQMLSLPA